MQPMNTRVWRKGLRETKRGIPTGRRSTHPIQATYGHQQRDREWRAAWAAMRAEFEAQKAAKVIQVCMACGHPDQHWAVPGPAGWPMKNLKCAQCPAGLCVLPDDPAPADAET